MFRVEMRFDEDKVKEYGYDLDKLYSMADKLATQKGAIKVGRGIYEKVDAVDAGQTIDCMFRFMKNKYILNLCNYCHLIDAEDGDCGDISYKFKTLTKYYPLEKYIEDNA